MSEKFPRLTFITGKGGVGKTSFAMAYTQYLKSKGLKARYNCFDQIPDYDLCRNLNIDYIELQAYESASVYIGKKLGGQMIAKWIMGTAFFNALFNMLPGLSMLIVLGHMIDLLQDDPDLHLVVDSPASGHALTMLESTINFKEIFGTGKLVEDIIKVQSFLYDKEKTQIYVLALATEMALQEGVELVKSIELLNFAAHKLYLNDAYFACSDITDSKELLPPFLHSKIESEKTVLSHFENHVTGVIPHMASQGALERIEGVTAYLKKRHQEEKLV